MALETQRTLPQLKKECEHRGITVIIEEGKKEHKEDYIKALRNYWIEKYYGSLDKAPWSLKFMLSIDCPMLCRRYQQCKPEQQRKFWESNEYIAEEKRDGCRALLTFDSSTQSFDFYSRNNSVKDFLPQSYKDTVLVTSKNFYYPDNFVLDCEVISTNPNLSTILQKRGTLCATQLQSTTALLALNPVESRALQEKDPLKFIIFDCLYDGESLMDKPWHIRHPHAEKLSELLIKSGFMCEINQVIYDKKLEFYSDVIERGGEGCFAGDTRIRMADHTLKPIKDVKEGDLVKSYDIEKKELVDKKVKHVFYNGKKPISEWHIVFYGKDICGTYGGSYTFEGCGVLCTKNHLFYNSHGWEESRDISFCYAYDYFKNLRKREVLKKNAKDIIASNFYFPDGYIDAYDIEVEDTHCYFAEDILVHNCVFKNINAPYHATTSRTIDQVKIKRTISEGINRDLDAWVTGFIQSSQDKKWSDLIGSLVFSCKVKMLDGTEKLHQIGVCSGIPFELRKEATVYDENGNPALNPEWLGRVATLSGQNISARKLALTHAVIVTWRPDKDPDGCEVLTEEELRSLIF